METKYEAAKAIISKIDKVARPEVGTIQADGMVGLSRQGVIPNDSTLHTTTSYGAACRLAGLEQDEDGLWFVASDGTELTHCDGCDTDKVRTEDWENTALGETRCEDCVALSREEDEIAAEQQ